MAVLSRGHATPRLLPVSQNHHGGLGAGAEHRTGEAANEPLFRVVPLLRLSAASDRILVGQARIFGGPNLELRIELALDAVWHRDGDSWLEGRDEDNRRCVPEDLLDYPAHSLHPADPQQRVALVAKGIAEGSRNAVNQLRGLRHDIEGSLARALRDHDGEADVLASLIELNRAVSRARDQARESQREGLWLWVKDTSGWYEYHRRLLDPTLLPARRTPSTDGTSETPELPEWLYTHDAAVRQCMAMERQLAEEAAVLYGLLDGAATIAVSRDADAQEHFNVIAAVAAIGLGLPALVLSLYGADSYLPLHSLRQFALLIPVVLAGGLAAFVGALARRRKGKAFSAELIGAFLIVAIAVTLLVAGVIAPETVAPK
jgi:hypothetical protein